MSIFSPKVRVRFAPSPTGHLHIGGLRSALFNWLFAKHANGIYLLRIEDTDKERSTDLYTQSILDAFSWLNIVSDEPIVVQSERLGEHRLLIEQLLSEKKAYRCYCTPGELERRLGKKSGDESFVPYDRYCLYNLKENAADAYVVRFKIPQEVSEITFEDIIRGTITFTVDQLDDFIIMRSDGLPVYNFSVVVDDAFMRISHVIRGEEHITNTPKQILLYQAYGYPVPYFAHLPVILGSDGTKLSKRDGATAVMDYRSAGYLADALINYLVRLGWSHKDQEIFSRDELVAYFSLDHVGKKGAIFDKEKLNWLNALYIKQKTAAELLQLIIDGVEPQLRMHLSLWTDAVLHQIIDCYKDRVKTLRELVDVLLLLYHGPDHFVPDDFRMWITPQSTIFIQELIADMSMHNEQYSVNPEQMVQQFVKQKGIKLVMIAQPLRMAMLGRAAGPGIGILLSIVSLPELIRRLQKVIDTYYGD